MRPIMQGGKNQAKDIRISINQHVEAVDKMLIAYGLSPQEASRFLVGPKILISNISWKTEQTYNKMYNRL